MKIRCWGSRGSSPVSGTTYSKTGGNTCCVEVCTDQEHIILDAGSGIRELGNRLIQEKQEYIHLIMTHAHWDHLIGFPFFRPLYRKKTILNIYAPKLTGLSFQALLDDFLTPPFFPITMNDIKAHLQFHHLDETPFNIASLTIDPILLNHPGGGFGYRFIENEKVFVFLTDNELGVMHENGHSFQDYQDFSRHADVLIHDAMYTSKEYPNMKNWGHTHYQDAVNLAIQAGVKRLGLFHHHPDRSDEDLDQLLIDCQKMIRHAQSDLDCFIVTQGWETIL